MKVGRRVPKRLPQVKRVSVIEVVVAGQGYHRTVEARDLVQVEIKDPVWNPGVVKDIANHQEGVGFQSLNAIDNSGESSFGQA